MTRHENDVVLALTRRYLGMIEGRELSLDEKQAFIAETVEAYERHVNRGYIGYRKSVTEAGQFAALEWSGSGSVLRDLLDREYIDCLGGYGIFSAGVNHPRILSAVACQMQRMALNSQELLEPWRAALARLLAMVTPGELGDAFFINNGTDAIEGAIKLARLYTRRNLFISTLGGFHGKSMGSLSLMGKASFREPFAGGLQDVRFVPYGDADALEAELTPGSWSSRCRARREGSSRPPTTSRAPGSSAPRTVRCSSRTRSRPGWGAPARSGGWTTPGPCPTSCAWGSRSAAASCRSRRSSPRPRSGRC